jgi:hypothetical protein
MFPNTERQDNHPIAFFGAVTGLAVNCVEKTVYASTSRTTKDIRLKIYTEDEIN